MPYFSILMPTRNRANLLRESLKSAINQNFQDYEIIVSDNNSVDHTKDVVTSQMHLCDKLKYINPGVDLSMLEHWEFILNHAGGKYIIYLCDDDALLKSSLEIIHRLITKHSTDILVWKRGYYHHPDVPDQNLRETFSCNLGNGNLYELDSTLSARLFYNFDSRSYDFLPKMLNCVVSKQKIDECIERTSTFFIPPFPDFSAACHLLGTSNTYFVVDLPLYICGISSFSNAGLQYDRKQKYQEYLNLFNYNLLEGIPYAMKYLIATYFLKTQYKFQEIYNDSFSNIPINFDAYFKTLLKEIRFFADYENISEELNQIKLYMLDYYGSIDQYQKFYKEIFQATCKQRIKRHLINLIKKILNATPILSKTHQKILKKRRKQNPQNFSRQNVKSIFEASLILDDIISQKTNSNSLKITCIDSMAAMEQIIL